jgi:hypothetical protein
VVAGHAVVLLGILLGTSASSAASSQEEIAAVVRDPANQDGLEACYQHALKLDPSLPISGMDVTVSVSAAGKVQQVAIDAPSSLAVVAPCVKSTVKRWRFPARAQSYATSFPLTFRGGNEIEEQDDIDELLRPPVALPTLRTSDIVNAMKGVQPKVQACANQFRVPGTAMVNVSVAAGGKVTAATVTGKFADTPTAACVVAAMKSAKFRRCEAMNYPWPFTLSPRGEPVQAECVATIGSKPWAELSIDGKRTGGATPVIDYPIPCGKHRLTFKNADLMIERSFEVTLARGQPFKRIFNLVENDR